MEVNVVRPGDGEELTVEDDVREALYEGELLSLSIEQGGQHALVVCENPVQVEERFRDECSDSIVRYRQSIPQRIYEYLHRFVSMYCFEYILSSFRKVKRKIL